LIAYCNLALFMTNSTFNPTCADNGSVNEYVYVCVCMYVCTYVCMYVCIDVGKMESNCVQDYEVYWGVFTTKSLGSWSMCQILTHIQVRATVP